MIAILFRYFNARGRYCPQTFSNMALLPFWFPVAHNNLSTHQNFTTGPPGWCFPLHLMDLWDFIYIYIYIYIYTYTYIHTYTHTHSRIHLCKFFELPVLGLTRRRRKSRILQKVIIIMYIYHALNNALSAHMIHINLNMIFHTYVEHSPTKTIYIKNKLKNALQTHTHARTHPPPPPHTHTHTMTVAETGYWY